MNSEDCATQFAAVPAEDMMLFLSLLVLELTIRARGAYEEQKSAGREFNEMIHRLAGQLVALTKCSADKYPDEVLARVLFEIAEGNECVADLEQAIAWARSHCKR